MLLAVLLLAPLSAAAFAVTDGDADSWAAPKTGLVLQLPDAYREAKGYVFFDDMGEGVNPGTGIVSARANYISMRANKSRTAAACSFLNREKQGVSRSLLSFFLSFPAQSRAMCRNRNLQKVTETHNFETGERPRGAWVGPKGATDLWKPLFRTCFSFRQTEKI